MPESGKIKEAPTETRGEREPKKPKGHSNREARQRHQHTSRGSQQDPPGGIEPPQQVHYNHAEQEVAETEIEEIERRLHMAAAEIDWEEEVSETMAAEGIQKRQSNPDYKGDDMSRRGKEDLRNLCGTFLINPKIAALRLLPIPPAPYQ